MTTLQATIPDDIHEAVNSQRSTLNSQPAQRAAVALPLPGLTVEERAARGNWEDFDRIMSRVPDAPPVSGAGGGGGSEGEGGLGSERLLVWLLNISI